MEYSIWLDVCSILTLISLILANRIKKTASFYRNNLVLQSILVLLLNTLVDLIAINGHIITNRFLLYSLHSLKYILMYAALGYMIVYTSVAVNQRIHGRNILKLFIAPIIFIFTLLIYNYNTEFVFSITAGGFFEYGPYFAIFSCLDLYYISVASYLLIRGRLALSKNHKILIPAIPIIFVTGTVFDYLFPEAASLQFTSTVFITLVFSYMQNPSEYYSDDSLMMSRDAFISMCGSRFSPESHTQCIAINIHNYDLLVKTVEKNRILHAEGIFIKSLKQFSKKLLIFKVNNGQYIIIMDENNETEAKLVYEETCSIMKILSNSTRLSIPIYSTCCAFSSPKHVSSIRMVDNLFSALRLYENRDNLFTVDVNELNIKSDEEILRIEELVKTALNDNRLEVYFQPIYNTEKKKFTSAEALIRMKDNEGNFVPPDIFIPIAEKSSLIIDIGNFVLNEVCRVISEEHLSDYDFEYIEVNVSMVECLQSNLASNVMSVLKQYRIFPSQINLEITETSASEFTDIVDKNIKTLYNKNITFSLDDFGTGYSSLSRILSLPLKLIKIDKSIVQAPFIST
ncbi:MAG: EAL domain-containing protein, partial [Catonella sp.]|uniref:EAL domain-containing protein n=1 Tax=Catonella sp. TaxID=2382125 RepID=UPI003F9FE200